MIPRAALRTIARARLQEATLLLQAGHDDGAVYLCGYAVEVMLKARICRTLSWAGYPETSGEFQHYRSFQTHDLDVLLHLSGVETKIKTAFLREWSAVVWWEPEIRYKPIGSVAQHNAATMITSTQTLLRVL